MDNNTRQNQYEQLYEELMTRSLDLHENNKKRIRRGLIGLVALPVGLGFVRWITDSDKVVFLIIWVICMFILCAYLISIEYLDESVQKMLEDATEREAEFDHLLTSPDDLQEMIQERILERRQERQKDRAEMRQRLMNFIEERKAARESVRSARKSDDGGEQ